MALPPFFPDAKYVKFIDPEGAIPLRELCRIAGVACKASGPWTMRPIKVSYGKPCSITAEPWRLGVVSIEVPVHSHRGQARYALGALAYSNLFDPVARASIAREPWTRIDKRGWNLRWEHAQRQRKARRQRYSQNPDT